MRPHNRTTAQLDNPVYVTQPALPPLEEFTGYLKEIWDSRILTNNGPFHQQFEKELAGYLGVKYLSLFANGTLALVTALQALKVTGEVITTPFSFVATTHSLWWNNIKPVFVDIEPERFTIDPGRIEAAITPQTTAIMAVHVYGNPCYTDEIQKIADTYGIKVIYDAAHAFGVTVDSAGVANFGDASMFSFHATKVFHTIEGGAVTYKDVGLSKILDGLKNFGITGPESVEYVGGNAKMNEFQAAMGICNLRHVEENVSKRKVAVERYIERLMGNSGIKLCDPQAGVKSNYAYFPVVFDGYKSSRDEIFEKLRAENIHARKYFYPLTNSFECYKGRFDVNETPVARYIAERVLTLPLYADLDLDDVDRICDIILR